jgi:thiosulfate/3-mercaptopyruvate sulfurtransferase
MLIVMAACDQEKVADTKLAPYSYLIEAHEFRAAIHRPHIKLIDFRKEVDYEHEHIPGALNIWRSDIEDTSFEYGGMMASKHQIESLFSTMGIGSQDTILIYDDNGLCNATRLWWILQNYDFDQVKLLHGGIDAWTGIGGVLTNENQQMAKAKFILTDSPTMRFYLSKEEVKDALDVGADIVDTRTTDEYSGKRQKKGASKGGRIPGSIHIDWADAIDYNGDKRLRKVEELEGIYGGLNSAKDIPIILYCHSGVRSAHTMFVLTQVLGYTNVKNYDGSWTEWSYFNDLPVERDSLTQITQ